MRAFQNVAEAENTSGRGDSTGERAMMTPRGRENSSWYGTDSGGTLTNHARLLSRVLMKQSATSLSLLAVMDIHATVTDMVQTQ
jgi:hypothetical protein